MIFRSLTNLKTLSSSTYSLLKSIYMTHLLPLNVSRQCTIGLSQNSVADNGLSSSTDTWIQLETVHHSLPKFLSILRLEAAELFSDIRSCTFFYMRFFISWMKVSNLFQSLLLRESGTNSSSSSGCPAWQKPPAEKALFFADYSLSSLLVSSDYLSLDNSFWATNPWSRLRSKEHALNKIGLC